MQLFGLPINLKPRVWILGGGGSLVMLGMLSSFSDISIVWDRLSKVSIEHFASIGALLLMASTLYAWRLKVLDFTQKAHGHLAYFFSSTVFTMCGLTMPARLGDVALAYLLHQKVRMPVGAAVVSILYQRFIDLCIVGVLLLSAAAATDIAPDYKTSLLTLAIVSFVVFFILLVRMRAVTRWLALLLYHRIGRHKPIVRKILSKVIEAHHWSARLNDLGFVTNLLLSTICFWLANLASIYAVITAFDAPVSLAEAVLVTAGYILISALPFPTLGGLGVAEAGMAGMFLAIGMPLAEATTLGILVRITLMVMHVSIATVCSVLVWLTSPQIRQARYK